MKTPVDNLSFSAWGFHSLGFLCKIKLMILCFITEPKVFKQDTIEDNKRPQDDKIDNPELRDAIAVFFGLLTLLVLFTVVMILIL